MGERAEALRANSARTTLCAALTVAVVGGLVNGWQLGRPGLWRDETATRVAAERDWSLLWAMVQQIDLVHASYYAAMHVWVQLFGSSPVALRVPSLIGLMVAVAATVGLGRIMLGSLRGAVVAGLVLSWLPLATSSSVEARAQTWVMALGCLVVLTWWRAVSRPERWRRWVLHGLLAVIMIHVSVVSTVLLLVFPVVLMLRRRPRAWPPWIVTCLVIGSLCLPVLRGAMRQQAQLAWVPGVDGRQVLAAFTATFWAREPYVWVIGTALTLAGVVALARRGAPFRARLALLVGLWLLPTAVLLVVSAIGSPLYTPRYVIISLPAVALLVAAVGLRLPHWSSVLLVALVVLLCLPSHRAARVEDAKGDKWLAMARLLEHHAQPGDVVLFADEPPYRRVRYAYPDAFTGLVDATTAVDAVHSTTLWGITRPATEAVAFTDGATRVWLIGDKAFPYGPESRLVEQRGFRRDKDMHLIAGHARLSLFVR
ncbi:glycosyltransferase family 39 protein [Propionibacteriaceae bacterium Y1685]